MCVWLTQFHNEVHGNRDIIASSIGHWRPFSTGALTQSWSINMHFCCDSPSQSSVYPECQGGSQDSCQVTCGIMFSGCVFHFWGSQKKNQEFLDTWHMLPLRLMMNPPWNCADSVLLGVRCVLLPLSIRISFIDLECEHIQGIMIQFCNQVCLLDSSPHLRPDRHRPKLQHDWLMETNNHVGN